MEDTAQKLLALLKQYNLKLATAESCTGGLLAGALTAIPGSSCCFEGGFITYSNRAKQTLLNVPPSILANYGAVSSQTAAAMAKGTRQLLAADIGVSVTGIAGPGGATPEKPVGLVYIGYSSAKAEDTDRHIFKGSRDEVRAQTVQAALELVISHLPKEVL